MINSVHVIVEMESVYLKQMLFCSVVDVSAEDADKSAGKLIY